MDDSLLKSLFIMVDNKTWFQIGYWAGVQRAGSNGWWWRVIGMIGVECNGQSPNICEPRWVEMLILSPRRWKKRVRVARFSSVCPFQKIEIIPLDTVLMQKPVSKSCDLSGGISLDSALFWFLFYGAYLIHPTASGWGRKIRLQATSGWQRLELSSL